MKKSKSAFGQVRAPRNTKQRNTKSKVLSNLSHVGHEFIPKPGTQAFVILDLLADGLPHLQEELLFLLGVDPRSALQSLRNQAHGFWLIHNLGEKKGIYRLDERHLSGDSSDDQKARLIAEMKLKEDSRVLAERESRRLEKAIIEEANTQMRFQSSLQI